jgi:hypothetical protein
LSNQQGQLAQLFQVSFEFATFLVLNQEIHDGDVHTQLQNDPVKHLWAIK